MPQSNIDPLDGAHEWCAQEGTDIRIALAEYNAWLLRTYPKEFCLTIKEAVDLFWRPGCFYGLAGAPE